MVVEGRMVVGVGVTSVWIYHPHVMVTPPLVVAKGRSSRTPSETGTIVALMGPRVASHHGTGIELVGVWITIHGWPTPRMAAIRSRWGKLSGRDVAETEPHSGQGGRRAWVGSLVVGVTIRSVRGSRGGGKVTTLSAWRRVVVVGVVWTATSSGKHCEC